MAGRIKMPLGREADVGLGDIVRWESSYTPKKGHNPHFSARVYCDQTTGWIKMLLGTVVDLGRGKVPSFPSGKGHSTPLGWWRSPAVEHRSLVGVLSLSCARLVADG